MIKLKTNSFFGFTIRKDIDCQHQFKTERWLETECDDRVEKNHKSQNVSCIAKLENDEGIYEHKTAKNNRMPTHSSAFISRNSKKNQNYFELSKKLKVNTNKIHIDSKPLGYF